MAIFLELCNVSVYFHVNNKKSHNYPSNNQNAKSTVGGEIRLKNEDLYIHALENISFYLKEGDRLGIVGPNGSGKSTLLRVISQIIQPTNGSIQYNGKIVPALSSSGGLELDISVEENILYRTALLGYKIDNINNFINEILVWADLTNYRHMPIRILSPGMRARLGFGLTTAFKSDILLIDEWMGVGDKDFREKAKTRWRNMVDNAGILVMCSHSEEIISSFCNKTLSLRAGKQVAFNEK